MSGLREFLSRVLWLPVLVLVAGVVAAGLALSGRVEQGAVVAVVCLAWAVLARGEA